MKRLFVLALAVLITLLAVGCGLWEPDPPELISPEDGATFTSDPPSFVWAANEESDMCRLVIFTDSTLGSMPIMDGIMYDTFYTFPSDFFDCLPSGTYYWTVGLSYEDQQAWSGRSFNVDHELPELDLDTTYFPLDVGYKWVYATGGSDTNLVEVTNAVSRNNQTTYHISVNGEMSYYLPDQTIRLGNVLYLNRGEDTYFPSRTYPLIGTEDTIWIGSSYDGDDDYYGHVYTTLGAKFVKGLGIIYQERGIDTPYGGDSYTDRLLYFIKGQDTVWRSP